MTEKQHWPDPVYLTKDHAINMTLRDYFAARAMQGMCASPNADPSIGENEWAEVAYKIADAMLKAREQ